MQLHGSLTSPYVRLCRVAADVLGADLPLVRTDPFADGIRALNPLGRVPALKAHDGTLIADSGGILRYLDERHGPSLFAAEGLPRHQADAATALALGVLDLGVASLLETRRPEPERSASWQARRREGVDAALPVLAGWAARLAGGPGIVALSYAVTLDWLAFRLPEVAWRDHEALAGLADAQLATPRFRATDPRDA